METATQIMNEDVFADVIKRVNEKEFYYHATGQEFEIDAEKCSVAFEVDAEVDLDVGDFTSFFIHSFCTCDEYNEEVEISEEQALMIEVAVKKNTTIELN